MGGGRLGRRCSFKEFLSERGPKVAFQSASTPAGDAGNFAGGHPGPQRHGPVSSERKHVTDA